MEDMRIDLKELLEQEREQRYKNMKSNREWYEKELVRALASNPTGVSSFVVEISEKDIKHFVDLVKDHARQNGYSVPVIEHCSWRTLKFRVCNGRRFASTLFLPQPLPFFLGLAGIVIFGMKIFL